MKASQRSLFVVAAAACALSAHAPRAGAQEKKVDPCSLLTRAEVQSATGRKNYDPADRGDPGDGVGGGDPCTYSHLGRGPADPAPPTVSVVAITPNQRGRYFDFKKTYKLAAGCTREAVPGLGVDAFVELCPRDPELPVYLRGSKQDVVVGVEVKPIGTPAQAKAVAIALAKVVAPKIK